MKTPDGLLERVGRFARYRIDEYAEIAYLALRVAFVIFVVYVLKGCN